MKMYLFWDTTDKAIILQEDVYFEVVHILHRNEIKSFMGLRNERKRIERERVSEGSLRSVKKHSSLTVMAIA